jgi:hypothetical protein
MSWTLFLGLSQSGISFGAYDEKAQLLEPIEIPNFQWTPQHPVRLWLEGFFPQGKVPIYQYNSHDGLIVPKKAADTPVQTSLPTFSVAQKTSKASMKKPELPSDALKDWLKTGSAEGAVEVIFVLMSSSPEKDSINFATFSKLLSQSIRPKLFNYWALAPGSPSPAQENQALPPLPSFEIAPIQKIHDPLLIETCHYLSKWLKTIQILSRRKISSGPKVFVDCRFKLKKNENFLDSKENFSQELKITRLSLPLFDRDMYRFEIETELDTQSVTALAKLRKLRK